MINMDFRGRRVKRDRWLYADPCVVQARVEAVIPEDESSEPCFEPGTIEFLRQVRERADNGDIDWLDRVGQVYIRLPETP